jgi:hypothetical protein
MSFDRQEDRAMPRKRHKPEEIVAKLRQVDVLVSRGQRVADAARAIGVTEVTYYGIVTLAKNRPFQWDLLPRRGLQLLDIPPCGL